MYQRILIIFNTKEDEVIEKQREREREAYFCHPCKQFKATVQVIYVSVSSDVRRNI